MSDRDGKRGGSRVAIGCGLVVFLVPVVYVLSIGPVVWLMRSPSGPPQWFQVFYYPLAWLAGNYKPFQVALGWYMGFWN
jgi:hypothetical protein